MAAESREGGPVSVPPGEGRSVWLVGDLIEVKLPSEATGGVYSMVEEMSPPGGGPPPHTHLNEDEALYVLEGEVEFLLGEGSVPAGVGSCVYASRGVLHTWRNVGSAPSRILGVITPGGLESFFLEAGEPAEDVSTPPGQPDFEKVMAAAAKYGVEIPPPPQQ